MERAIRVKADDVLLRLTLSSKLQQRAFSEAVLAPFVKAYNRKKGTNWAINDLVSVTVDGALITDYSVPSSVVLLANETVDAELCFCTQPTRELLLEADPFTEQKWQAPEGGNTHFNFDEDDRSEVEKLKAKRREARLAKEATLAEVPPSDTAASFASASVAATSAAAGSEPPISASPDVPPLAAEAYAALDELEMSERMVVRLRTELEQLAGQAATTLPPDERSTQLREATRQIGQLSEKLDALALSGVADAERDAARARKKRIVAILETELLPNARRLAAAAQPATLQSHAGAQLQSAQAQASAPRETRSAEIDSDED